MSACGFQRITTRSYRLCLDKMTVWSTLFFYSNFSLFSFYEHNCTQLKKVFTNGCNRHFFFFFLNSIPFPPEDVRSISLDIFFETFSCFITIVHKTHSNSVARQIFVRIHTIQNAPIKSTHSYPKQKSLHSIATAIRCNEILRIQSCCTG